MQTLSVALGKAEVTFQKVSFLLLPCFRFFAMSCPCCLFDMVFRCGRAVNVLWLVLAVEKRGSCSSLKLHVFSKMLQILSLAVPVVCLMMTFQLYHYLDKFYLAIYHLCHFLQFQYRFGWMVSCQILSGGTSFQFFFKCNWRVLKPLWTFNPCKSKCFTSLVYIFGYSCSLNIQTHAHIEWLICNIIR